LSEKNNQCANLINKIESNLYIFTKFPIIGLLVISIIAIFIRLLFLDTELPIRQDANAYFWYAMDMSILNQFPSSGHTNDGWSIFLSFFFSIFNFNNYLDYTILQRIITICISVLTIIPIYFLSKKFVDKEYAILAGALFVFEPHIIQNSIQGLTEPLYIFLVTLSITLFLTNNIRFQYIAFAIIALSVIVRAEGIIILGIATIGFFIIQKRDKKIIRKYTIAILIFILIFGTMMIVKTQTSGYPSTIGFIANIGIGSVIDSEIIPDSNSDLWGISSSDVENGIWTLAKRLAQTLIPYFVFFLPFGIFLLFQNRKKNNIFLLLAVTIYTIALIRMFILVQDLRLMLVLYPLFSIISVIAIQHLTLKIEIKKIFLISIIIGILILSWFTLYSTIESEYEKEVNLFANYMVNNVNVSNNFYPESGYIYGVWASSNLEFPIISYNAKYNGPSLLDYVKDSYDYLENNADSIEEYIIISKDQGLSHLVVDDNDKRTLYFNDLFHNEEKYPYLIKEFDSIEHGYKQYKVKVFRINYNDFKILNLE
jgi:4-amino-4-deoxy-L-arabinose transferase-like glycosyltransferase